MMESQRLKTAKKFMGQFATLDTETLASLLARDYTHQFAPASVSALPGPFGRQQFLDHIGGMRGIMKGFPVRAREYVESEGSNMVVVWATSRAMFREEATGGAGPGSGEGEGEWAYEGEYVFFLGMDDAGEKIVRTVEFLDSKGADGRLRPMMKRAWENISRGE